MTSIATLSLAMTAHAFPSASISHIQEQLQHWPASAARSLSEMIARNANTSAFAVFDADNTIWRYDIEESSLPYLENKGVITRATLDPILRLIDFKDTANYTETLYSYYNRLCEIDALVCYPWAAQVYSGLSLRELKGHIDELMAYNGTIPTSYWDGDVVVQEEINPARPFTGQKELMQTLMANGIDVWIVSASNEEVVRMVVSDPQYGYNIRPENVLGVSITMRNTTTGDLTTSRKQIADGVYDQAANLDLVLGSYLWTPATWYAGKWAAVLTYISMWKKPVLAAGDTPGSDTYMHFNVDVEKGGVHLWVNKSASNWEALQGLIEDNVEGQKDNGLAVTADKNWVVVLPTDIQ
ncbi:phosphorylcholine phosphatase [Pleomassaria siparia CBS 279.74]|uniref:Phosphorylcholine phosphatase n=1 Tax=Pleomassaria siparia CBS 279.74 TaxID=1314801 RepID=A0A6G1KR42_9PLEO|nr:phosphorylcholine phosphatase [Pleomassaria siparia CBS 279.74]